MTNGKPLSGEAHAQALREIDAERDAVNDEFDRMEKAAAEDTFSGHLRRAIHRAPLPLAALVHQAQVDRNVLQAFLLGTGVLESHSIDRIAQVLHLELQAASVREP